MEGLSYRYERDAYVMAAGYGLSHSKVGEAPQVDLIALADRPGYARFLFALYRIVGEPLVPWGLRNQRVNGTFNLTTHASGMTLYGNIDELPNPYGIVWLALFGQFAAPGAWIERLSGRGGTEENVA
jgi:hypothetical protein